MKLNSLPRTLPVAIAIAVLPCVAPAAVIDISAKFNRDTIAGRFSEPRNGGYRNLGEVFVAETPNSNPFFSNGATDLPIADASGGATIAANGRDYKIGPYDQVGGTQLNTWILDVDGTTAPASQSIQLAAPQRWSDFGVLFTGVGYNAQGSIADRLGDVVVRYADGSEDRFDWDLVDSNGSGRVGAAKSAITRMNLHSHSRERLVGFADRAWYTQDFSGIDPTKTVVELEFTANVPDINNDANFGIYALSATVVPEPAAAVFLGLTGMILRRRRTA